MDRGNIMDRKGIGSTEQRIQDFYDNVPDVQDALPFKDYLLKHEDSRMAWYLLGKQYEAKGETRKAAYCFGHAGEIYEAFEGKPAPKTPNLKLQSMQRRRGYWRKTTLAVLLLILA